MLHVTTRGNACAIKVAEEMLDVILGEYANAGKGVKSFHGAVEKLAKEEEIILVFYLAGTR